MLLIDDLFPSSSGTGCSVETQTQKLTDLGHWVSLIAPSRHLEKPRSCHIIECPAIYIEGLPAHLSILHNSERHARLITKCARSDVMYTQTERGALILNARIARLQGTPHLHTFRVNVAGTHQTAKAVILGTWLYQSLINPLFTRAAGRASSRPRLVSQSQEPDGLTARMDWVSFAGVAGKVDAWTVPSPFMKDLVETAATHQVPGCMAPTGIGRDMPDAISQVHRGRSGEVVRFTIVGRLAKEKRLGVLVWAFRHASISSSELVIVGDGDQRPLFKVLTMGIGNIDFRSHLCSLDAIAYGPVSSDVPVLTSHRFDSQALVLSETMVAGLPTLYCDDRLAVATSPESASLIEPDISSLAARMRKFADPEWHAAIRSASRGLLEELTPWHIAETYISIYEELIGAEGA